MLASFNFPWFFLMLAILVLIVMVLYLSAFSLLLGGSVFLLFWVWTIGLYPDWIDGENFRKIPIGALFLKLLSKAPNAIL